MLDNIHPKQTSALGLGKNRSIIKRNNILFGHVSYNNIISIENLLESWREFLPGKRKRKEVALFSLRLLDNILTLHHELKNKDYRHGSYQAFKINDPKPREINKASIRDRIVRRAIYRILYPYFDRKFVFDSFSCRREKGTHRAINRFREYCQKISLNYTRTAWVLKCDIKKFFASIDHKILINILNKKIKDDNVRWLLDEVINSFHTKNKIGQGLPLGNLTSQLLANIYLNELDYFLKRNLKVKYCVRYADDFVIIHYCKKYLEQLILEISNFLTADLRLSLHPQKIFLKTIASGVDFLGWVHFAYHRVIRTSTKKRLIKRIKDNPTPETIASYLGLLKNGNTYKIRKEIFKDNLN